MHAIRAGASLAALVLFVCSNALGGPLTPPGAPAPTMKTLNEVEARIPVGPLTTPGDADSVYRISQPGSYYLTGDVMGQIGKCGVEINASDVTLDLNGYALRGVAGATYGVMMLSFVTDGVVRNGVVSDWPFSGVLFRADGGLVSDIQVRSCGGWGIDATGTYMPRIERSSVLFSGGATGIGGGIAASEGRITDCVVRAVSGTGIIASQGVVQNCSVHAVVADTSAAQTGVGISAVLVESSMVSSCADIGIYASRLARACVSFSSPTPYSGPLVLDSN